MNGNYQEISNAILRISLGIIFLAHGLLKIMVFTLAGTVGFFESIGLPGWLAYPVTFGEVLGGAALIVGLFTRPVLALMIPILLGATWAHSGNGWVFNAENGGWEYPLFLVVTSVVALLAGPGKWSLQKA